MRIRIFTSIVALAFLAALGSPFPLSGQDKEGQTKQAQITKYAPYMFFKLGTLGGSVSGPNSINSEAWVTGASNLRENQTEQATLWISGATIPLGTLGGSNSAVTWPNHNNHGLIAGIAETSIVEQVPEFWSCYEAFFPTFTGHTCQGFVWQAGFMTALPTLGGPNGFAAGSNNLDQVVGWAENTVHDRTCITPQVFQFEAVIYGTQPGQPTIKVLAPLSPDPDGAATAINDKGQAVGISGLCANAVGGWSAKHALLWDKDGSVVNLGSLGGKTWNTPMAISNKGEIVGFSDLDGDVKDHIASFNAHAFIWTPRDRLMTDLGTIPNDAISWASGINDHSQVVGRSCVDATLSVCTGVLWEKNEVIDLNSLIPHDPSLYIVFGNDINDFGEIAGTVCVVSNGVCSDTLYTFLAVPTGIPILPAEGRLQESSKIQDSLERRALPESARQQMLRQLGVIRPIPAQ